MCVAINGTIWGGYVLGTTHVTGHVAVQVAIHVTDSCQTQRGKKKIYVTDHVAVHVGIHETSGSLGTEKTICKGYQFMLLSMPHIVGKLSI